MRGRWLPWRLLGCGSPHLQWPWRPLPDGYRGAIMYDKAYPLTPRQRMLVLLSGRIIIRTAIMTDCEILRYKFEDQLTVAPPDWKPVEGSHEGKRGDEVSVEKLRNREALKGDNPNPGSPWKAEPKA